MNDKIKEIQDYLERLSTLNAAIRNANRWQDRIKEFCEEDKKQAKNEENKGLTPHTLSSDDMLKEFPYVSSLPIYVSHMIAPNRAFFVSQLQNPPIRPENRVAAISQLSADNRKRDELKADHALKQLGVTPRIFHFFENVYPFYAVTIADEVLARSAIKCKLEKLFNEFDFENIYGPATLLRKKLREDGIYGVAICDRHDTFNYQRGRTIAKGRLAKHLGRRKTKRQDIRKKVEKRQEWPTMKPRYIIESDNAGVIDDPIRKLTEEQRAQGKEWYKKHKSYFEAHQGKMMSKQEGILIKRKRREGRRKR